MELVFRAWKSPAAVHSVTANCYQNGSRLSARARLQGQQRVLGGIGIPDLRRRTLVEPTPWYHFEFGLNGNLTLKLWNHAETDTKNATVFQVELMDEDENIISHKLHGYSTSERFGTYRYLHASEEPNFTLVEIPRAENAASGRFRLIPWQAKSSTVISDFRPKGSPIRSVVGAGDLVRRFAALAESANSALVLYAGSKTIGLDNRANRAMMFAREGAGFGTPVMYVYSGAEPEDPLALPNIVQISHDAFASVHSDVSRIDCATKALVTSMPDLVATQMQDTFRWKNWRVIYDVRDEWEEFASVGQATWWDEAFERRIALTADHVSCVSLPLARKMVAIGVAEGRVSVVPNGTTPEFVALATAPRADRAVVNTIGYFGHLTPSWFDWGTVIYLAESMPHLQIELIGFDPGRNLSLPENIRYLGPRDHQEIIEIARNWGAALIPFKISKLSRAVDPIKVYEYLALGLRVYSVPMGDVENYPGVEIYRNADELIRLIQQPDWSAQPPHESVAALLSRATWRDRLMLTLENGGIRLPKRSQPL